MIYLICLSILYSFNSHADSFSLELDNDILTQTDYYYSNGLLIEYESDKLATARPWKWLGDKSETGVSFKHEISTPVDTGTSLAQPGDHPYSAVLYTSMFNKYIAEDKESSKEVLLGVIGPLAYGEKIQNGIHDLFPSHPVNGWAHQLKNDLLLNFNYELWTKNRGHSFTYGPWYRAELGTYSTQFHFAYRSEVLFYKNHQFEIQFGAYLNFFDVKLQGGVFSDDEYGLSSDEVKTLNYLGKIFYRYRRKAHEIRLGNSFKGVQFKGGKPHSWTTLGYKYHF
ncbi:lipid A-modifier LpxR family protein [Halobacteriovorax sp. HLS]|uniref:lipid A-modifier LpxR family protein n=1 Tax=Halobacteriovorax sp. HLS TaxID=2234000 RepID=UPI000FDA1B01|nr:lipid A-modifier LpxR family protein [Halobacteriovorax sp. HLS]